MAALQDAGKQRLRQMGTDSAKLHADMQQSLGELRAACWDSLCNKGFQPGRLASYQHAGDGLSCTDSAAL